MTAALSPSILACRLITLYQQHLSPRKGFRCAYRARHGRRSSCSRFAQRAVERLGVLPGLRLLRRRFDRCDRAADAMSDEERRARQKGRWKDGCWSAADSAACDPRSPVDACDVASIGCDVASCGCDLLF